MKKRLLSVLLCLLALLALPGCSSGGVSASAPTPAPAKKIALVLPDEDDQWEGSLIRFAKAELDTLGAEYVPYPAVTEEEQLSALAYCVEEKPDAILLSPLSEDPAPLLESLRQCEKAKIPVVLVGGQWPEDTPAVVGAVVPDYAGAGAVLAGYLEEKGKTNIALCLDSASLMQRSVQKALRDALPASIHIVLEADASTEAAREAMLKEYLLNDDPLDAVLCMSDELVPQVVSALDSLDSKVIVLGCGGCSAVLKEIVENHHSVKATALCSPEIASRAAECAYQAASGETLDAKVTTVSSALYCGLDAAAVYTPDALY